MWPAVSSRGQADPFGRYSSARLAALVPRPTSHELRCRLGVRRGSAPWLSQFGGLLLELHLELPFLPELAFPPVVSEPEQDHQCRGAGFGGQHAHFLRMLFWRRSSLADASCSVSSETTCQAEGTGLLGDKRHDEPQTTGCSSPVFPQHRWVH